MKAYATAYTTAGVSAPWVTYQSVAGGPGPTFYLIMPMESYANIDADLTTMAAVGAKLPSPAAVAAQFAASVERMETQVLTAEPADQLRAVGFFQSGQGVLAGQVGSPMPLTGRKLRRWCAVGP